MTKCNSELIVMLTHNDRTVENAFHIFDECKDSLAKFWGFKEQGLPLEQMKELFAYMKKHGKITVLEVVSYTEEEGLKGAAIAAECGCDILMGTMFYDSINTFCKEHNIKYMPFIGKITGRPSVLEGTCEDMLNETGKYLKKGVYGFDLLGYRYTGDAYSLSKSVVSGTTAPVCLAGSINSWHRLDEVKELSPWTFTIGGAFFENRFGGTFCEQINKVCEYITH